MSEKEGEAIACLRKPEAFHQKVGTSEGTTAEKKPFFTQEEVLSAPDLGSGSISKRSLEKEKGLFSHPP